MTRRYQIRPRKSRVGRDFRAIFTIRATLDFLGDRRRAARLGAVPLLGTGLNLAICAMFRSAGPRGDLSVPLDRLPHGEVGRSRRLRVVFRNSGVVSLEAPTISR